MEAEDVGDLIAGLKSSTGKEEESESLVRAISLLESLRAEDIEPGDVLASLLTDVLKPLFASTPNPSLTPAGRKSLVPAPPTTGRFNTPLLETERKPWKKASWSINLLRYIVAQYNSLPPSSRISVVEKQFYLLVPPILTLIDDGDISSKTSGCELLGALCSTISACESSILSRSGLADVFADSLKTNFMLLPTLTPENESLTLLCQLYPAFRALVSATYPLQPRPADTKNGESGSTSSKPLAVESTHFYSHRDRRQQMLDTVLRDGIMASYNHASDHVAIAELLIREAALVAYDMRINAVKYLSRLLPLLRNILTNPLGAAYPPLLEAACDLLSALITTCKPRIASTWWVECLRMCVGCWVIIQEDLSGPSLIRTKVVNVVQMLRDVVGEEKYIEAADTLMKEDEQLLELLYPV
jgi:tRNA nucleotidyltransferase (CCA-adding enzyme)